MVIANVGAGTGSYEPHDRIVVALDPSIAMLEQRLSLRSAVCAQAEALPLSRRSVDAVLAVLTVHHWSNLERGLEECARVARSRLVLFTWIAPAEPFWLVRDYLPEFMVLDQRQFPSLERIRAALPAWEVRASPVLIPADCTDGFLGAYWRRPEAYLDSTVQSAVSSFQRIDATAGLAALRRDLESGEWERRHGHLLSRPELDLGYTLVVAERSKAMV